MGHIVVMDDSRAQFALTRYSRDLWHELAAELPPRSSSNACGTLWVAADEEEMAEVRRKAAFYRRRGVRTRDPGRGGAGRGGAESAPGPGGRTAGAGRQRDLRSLRGALAVRASPAARRHRRGAVRRGPRARMASRSPMARASPPESTVCATGTWASTLVPEVLDPRRARAPGHHRPLSRLRAASACRTRLSEERARHRRRFGRVQCPAARNGAGADRLVAPVRRRARRIDTDVLRAHAGRAMEYMPGLARLDVIRTWTGFRGATETNCR